MKWDAMKKGKTAANKLPQFTPEGILEATDAPVFICDSDLRIIYANASLLPRLAGKGKAIGKTVGAAFPEHAAKVVGGAVAEALRKGGTHTAHATNWENSGREPDWISFTVKKIPGHDAALGIGHDETQARLLHFQLYGKIQHLEHFRRLAVGREMRMMELKKENEALKSSIEGGA